jgi:hypothetical protein
VLDAADLFARRDGVSLRDIAASCSATTPSPGDQDRTTASFNPVRVLARVLEGNYEAGPDGAAATQARMRTVVPVIWEPGPPDVGTKGSWSRRPRGI